MFDATLTGADGDECVVLVGKLSDDVDSGFDYGFEVLNELLPVEVLTRAPSFNENRSVDLEPV
jgi:hypothetical protein